MPAVVCLRTDSTKNAQRLASCRKLEDCEKVYRVEVSLQCEVSCGAPLAHKQAAVETRALVYSRKESTKSDLRKDHFHLVEVLGVPKPVKIYLVEIARSIIEKKYLNLPALAH